ncbi:MAG: ParB/RepB/Spo0J family partition protein [Oscillospiraceae bacterium]|nr:ParB/RepB/Spo0J family partition protein [Oscillospiraceae bacterium]
MAGGSTQFEADVQQAVQKIKGVYFPVKTGMVARLLTKKAACRDLYPNPEDEFCRPDIGPNDGIISSYEQQFLANIRDGLYYFHDNEPIIIEQLHPDGYMIINGHHRWAAAVKIGQPEIPVHVVNLMHEADIREILRNTKHEKRATFDLDEVLVRSGDDPYLEKPLPAPWDKTYKVRIRLGVPALFHELEKSGYDIWLYSANYPSADDVQEYFRLYHVNVSGVIAALGKRKAAAGGADLEKLMQGRYRSTLHIDNDMVLQISSGMKEPREFPLSGAPETWSQEIIEVLEKLDGESEGRVRRYESFV